MSTEQLGQFTQRSDYRAAWMVLVNWLLIFGIFAGVAFWTHPLSLLLGAVLLGGRQLGLAILMHEAGHNTLFKSSRLNNVVGQWLCAYPILADVEAYAASHRQHHKLAGTEQDPDLPNYQAYPISKQSLRRKLWRDLSGQTGFGLLAGMFSKGSNNLMMRADDSSSRLTHGLLANAMLLALLALAGVIELYLLWVAAYVFFYPTVARIRQVAEHGAVINLFDPDPRANTRTTRANWLERLVLCPNHVNYHLEHHLLASVPSYHLKAFHKALYAQGFYQGYEQALVSGYWQVLKINVPQLNQQYA